jgi:hypothetical protein
MQTPGEKEQGVQKEQHRQSTDRSSCSMSKAKFHVASWKLNPSANEGLVGPQLSKLSKDKRSKENPRGLD